MHIGFFVFTILGVIPFQKAVKQSLWSCMVKMKDSVHWSKEGKLKECKLEL